MTWHECERTAMRLELLYADSGNSDMAHCLRGMAEAVRTRNTDARRVIETLSANAERTRQARGQ